MHHIVQLIAYTALLAGVFTVMALVADMPWNLREARERLERWYDRLLDDAEVFYDAQQAGEFQFSSWVAPSDPLPVRALWFARFVSFRLSATWLALKMRAYWFADRRLRAIAGVPNAHR